MYLELIFFFLSFARCWSFLHFVFVHSLLSSLFFILRSIEKNNENKCTIFKKNVVMYLQKQRFVSPTAQCVHYTVCIWNKYTHHAQMMHRNIKERRDRKKTKKKKQENHEETMKNSRRNSFFFFVCFLKDLLNQTNVQHTIFVEVLCATLQHKRKLYHLQMRARQLLETTLKNNLNK